MQKGIHTTKNFHRARVRSPKACALSSFRIKTLSKHKGIKAVICCPAKKFSRGRCKVGTIIQSVLYDKKKFTKNQAQAHRKKMF